MTRRATNGAAGAARQDGATETPARRAVAYRAAFLEAVTPADVAAIGAALLERAKTGDPAAARLVLDRVLGSQAVPAWPSAETAERDAQFAELLG